MLRLFDRLPDSVTVNGKKYRLNLDYRNVLRMLEIMGRDDLLPDSKRWLSVRCVMRWMMPKDYESVYVAVITLLFGDDREQGGDRITSFKQDADLIRAAFWQEYGINLYRDRLHWFEFLTLIQNLPYGSKYTDVLSIRTREVPAPNKYNAKEREELLKAKSRFSIELTEEEKKAKYRELTHRTFMSLSQIKRR